MAEETNAVPNHADPDSLVDEYLQNRNAAASGPSLPTGRKTADEVLDEMKRVPLFMNSLEEVSQEDNELLDALKAIAYEGTRSEIAENFKTQGNELVPTKRWQDAREFYTKAIQALHGPEPPQDPEAKVVEIDEEAEARQERALEEACYANRALCNLEMSITTSRPQTRCAHGDRLTNTLAENYGSCQRDCAACLKLNPRNTKAWFRAASACLALDKTPEALDACRRGLEVDPANSSLQILQEKVSKRQKEFAAAEQARQDREKRESDRKATLRYALSSRNIPVRGFQTDAVDMEDAAIALENSNDASSTLSFPTLFLYPMDAETDFVKAIREDESVGQHLSYVLPPPWDGGNGDYATPEDVECYMETIQGGLIKAGKNLSLLKLLSSGKVEIADGVVKVNVLPKAKSAAFIEEFKKRKGKQ